MFGGTTEGRRILESGLPVVYSVVTEYGAKPAEAFPGTEVLVGRMDASGIADYLENHEILGVIDATHPYAVEVSRNIKTACESLKIPVVRVARDRECPDTGDVLRVPSADAAVEALACREGNVLLTVGSKDLSRFTALDNYRERLYVRVLPTREVVAKCEEMGFDAGHILALQGPFSEAMNIAFLEMTKARILVTKDGGKNGGFREKLGAARSMGVEVLLVERPEDEGCSVEDALAWARSLLREKKAFRGKDAGVPLFPLFVRLAGNEAVVVGGGPVAARRVRALLSCGARTRVVSPLFCPDFGEISGTFERIERLYRAGDLEDARLAVAATDDRETNRKVGEEARVRNIPVSVADAPEECTFFFPALVNEGSVVAGISTSGFSPALSGRLAKRLREVWADWTGEESGRI